MDYKRDYDKWMLSNGISSLKQNRYRNNLTTSVVDHKFDGMVVDVFTKLLQDRIIFLNGEIYDEMTDIIKAQLLYLEQLDKEKDIKIYINSGGGSIYDGLGLIDTLEYVSNDIVTINTGIAASMAAVILCCGSKGKRKSLKRARTMIHQPLGYLGYSQAADIEIESKQIHSLKKELYEIISERTGQPFDKVASDSDRDYWMTSKEAKSYGMVDEILIKRK
jgi:ATP-dependent Clp protease protease subunit